MGSTKAPVVNSQRRTAPTPSPSIAADSGAAMPARKIASVGGASGGNAMTRFHTAAGGAWTTTSLSTASADSGGAGREHRLNRTSGSSTPELRSAEGWAVARRGHELAADALVRSAHLAPPGVDALDVGGLEGTTETRRHQTNPGLGGARDQPLGRIVPRVEREIERPPVDGHEHPAPQELVSEER